MLMWPTAPAVLARILQLKVQAVAAKVPENGPAMKLSPAVAAPVPVP
jgi:hypothetical protein